MYRQFEREYALDVLRNLIDFCFRLHMSQLVRNCECRRQTIVLNDGTW